MIGTGIESETEIAQDSTQGSVLKINKNMSTCKEQGPGFLFLSKFVILHWAKLYLTAWELELMSSAEL